MFPSSPARSYTYLRPLYTGLSVEAAIQYDQLFIVEGVLFGVMGAALGLAYLLTAGLVKAAIAPLRAALDRSCGRWPRVVALATLGGALTGVLGWAMPLVRLPSCRRQGLLGHCTLSLPSMLLRQSSAHHPCYWCRRR